jgi:predicted Zn-dependent protease
VDYLLAAGVDPRGILTLFGGFEREEAKEGGDALGGWFSTHPGSGERIRVTGRVIQERLGEAKPTELAVQIPSYQAFMARLRRLPPPDSHAFYEPLLPPGHPPLTGTPSVQLGVD